MDLRILGGIYKHRRIKLHSSFHDRPTLVRSRRMIFDILMNYIEVGFSFLDVFAGSGVMGIEALSRGASKVVFFDINSLYLKTIEKNLINMEKIIGIYSTIKTNALCPPDGSNFDVIFLDPPYEKYYIIPDVVKKLIKYNWIGEHTWIVTESFYKNPIELEDFEKFKESKISHSLVAFFKYNQNRK